MHALLAALMMVCSPQDTSIVETKPRTLRGLYTLEATVVGSAQLTRYEERPTQFSKTNLFPGSTFGGRLMWHPDHLLSIGVYSGFVTFSREDIMVLDTAGNPQKVTLDLTGIPAQVVFAMAPGNFQFGLGLGVYFLDSHISVNDGERVGSDAYEYGVSSWLAYDFHITDAISFGPEIGLHALSSMGVACGMVGLRLKVDVLSY